MLFPIQWLLIALVAMTLLGFVFFIKSLRVQKTKKTSSAQEERAAEVAAFVASTEEAFRTPVSIDPAPSVQEVEEEKVVQVDIPLDLVKEKVLPAEPTSPRSFFDDFFQRARVQGSLDFLPPMAKNVFLTGCEKKYYELHCLASYVFPTTKPRGFRMTQLRGRCVVVPFAQKCSIILFEEEGKIKIVMPEVQKAEGHGSKAKVLIFKPQDLDPADGSTGTPLLNQVREFALQRYKELGEVQAGKLHPEITYVWPSKDEKDGVVPGKLKGRDLTREVKFFDEVTAQLPPYQGEFYARTMKSFYSAASVKELGSKAVYHENARNHIRFILIPSSTPGYNVVLAKRKTNQTHYVQIAAIEPTPEEKALIAQGKRPFLDLKPQLLDLSDESSAQTAFLKEWVKTTGLSVSVF